MDAKEILDICSCTRLRTAARMITRTYDESLRGSGLNASQLSLLAAISAEEASSIAALSKTLFMDRTTLSRNLKPLMANGWIALAEEGGGRSKTVQLTRQGAAQLKAAIPHWSK